MAEKKPVIRKPQFVEQYAAKLGISKVEADPQVDAFLEVIQENMLDGNKVQFLGFGDFEAKETKERKGRNPQTGQEIQIPASKRPTFKPGNTLKDVVNGKVAYKAKVAEKVAKKDEEKKAKKGKKNRKK